MGVTLTTLGILGLHNISGTVEARNFKFDVEMEDIEYKRKNAKLGQKGSCGRQVIDFGILGHLISPGRMKLETSNLAESCMAVIINEKMQN